MSIPNLLNYYEYVNFAANHDKYEYSEIKRIRFQHKNAEGITSTGRRLSSLSYITQDISQISEGYILHVVNILGKMGKGVAKDLYEKHPKLKEEYVNYVYPMTQEDTCSQLLGTYTAFSNNLLVIINLFAQPTLAIKVAPTKVHLDYKALENALTRFNNDRVKSKPVYVPYYMGCGLANGDWKIVTDILRNTLCNVIICRKPNVSL